MFPDIDGFPFVADFEARWRDIEAEFEAVARLVRPWPETRLHAGGWRVFGLFDFPHGEPIKANTRRCPVTSSMVERLLPGHGAAGFSVLAPGTVIVPHQGYPGSFLRLHLGLRVPSGDCAIEVGGERRSWSAGKALIFDDRVEHRAWNHTRQDRVVLLVDFAER